MCVQVRACVCVCVCVCVLVSRWCPRYHSHVFEQAAIAKPRMFSHADYANSVMLCVRRQMANILQGVIVRETV